MSTNCPFCDKTQSYRYVLECKKVRAIYPLGPACAYHVLITPKRHIQLLSDMSDQEWQEVMKLLRQLHNGFRMHIDGYIGYNILSNNGDVGINQQVPHAHMHVFLRHIGDLTDPIRKPHSSTSNKLDASALRHLAELQNVVRTGISPLQ